MPSKSQQFTRISILVTLFVIPLSVGTGATNNRVSLPGAAELLRSQAFFEHNEGQVGKEALYLSQGLGYEVFFTKEGASLVFPQPARKTGPSPQIHNSVIKLTLIGADPDVGVTGVDLLPGKSNYFFGSEPKSWHTGIPQFAKVLYRHVYPGIDLVFYVRAGQLEFDFLVAPHANTDRIRLKLEGAEAALGPEGDVRIRVQEGAQFTLKKPSVNQPGAPNQRIRIRYLLSGKQLSLRLNERNPSLPVVIDPALIFSTYLYSYCPFFKGTEFDCFSSVNDLAVDGSGVYLTGVTSAPSFPSPQPAQVGLPRTFVVKFDPTGSSILYMTFLASSGGNSIALDSNGAAYVVGTATYPPFNGGGTFPVTSGVFSSPPAGACSSVANGCTVPFATKLSPAGVVQYSTLLQQFTPDGSNNTQLLLQPVKVAVDSNGALDIAGNTSPSPNGPMPLMPLPVPVGAFQAMPKGGNFNGFVMQLNRMGSALGYATYLSPGQITGIAVDTNTSAYAVGFAPIGYPTLPGAFQMQNGGASGGGIGPANAVVTKLAADGSGVYSTYFGGSGNDQGYGIAVDSTGEAVIVGWGFDPPTLNTVCSNGQSNPFIAKFNASGSSLIYANAYCLGGEFDSIALDTSGAAYVMGTTNSPAQFPIVNPIEATPPSATADVVVKFDSSGNLAWSTFFGSGQNPTGQPLSRVAVDAGGSVYLLSLVAPDTPITPGAFEEQPLLNSMQPPIPKFLAKIAPSLGQPVGVLIPTYVQFGSQVVGTSSAAVDVSLGNFGDAPMSATISITGDFSQTNTCAASIAAAQKCDVNVVFTPTAGGTRTGNLTVNFGGTVPALTVLTGNGTASGVSVSPSSLEFGPQTVGTTSAPQQVMVTNTGTAPLSITNIQTTGDFAETNACGSPIPPGNNCLLRVTFTPTATGARNGTLTLTDNAPNSPQTMSLLGGVSLNLAVASGSSNSATTQAGGTASYMLSIGGGGASGTASLACTGAPKGATCNVPATIPLNANSATTFSATVTTTSHTMAFSRPSDTFRISWASAVALLGIFILQNAGRKKRALLSITILLLLGWSVGCGSSGNNSSASNGVQANPNGTPAGTYNLVVTATSGPLSQSVTLALTVQ